ncbi:MAG TPA: antibiotic biosynthesis monooxygenase [Duganella sp.]|nr:antibiotic biosynthesis monooxygenase [Duganella sp.]
MSQLTFIVHLPAVPERLAELEAGVRGVLTAMSAEPDFVHCRLHRSQHEPNTLVVYETWTCSREHFLAHHIGKDYRAGFEQALAGRLAAPRRIEFLDDVDPPLHLSARAA